MAIKDKLGELCDIVIYLFFFLFLSLFFFGMICNAIFFGRRFGGIFFC